MSTIAHPEVEVQLSGEDGNAFAIIGSVSKALKRAGLVDEAKQFYTKAMGSDSYDSLLRLAMKTVAVN